MSFEDASLVKVSEWLEEKYKIKYTSGRQAARIFSDGVLLAEVLKQLYPNLVSMHSYQQKNSFQLKLNNWVVLNRKVLSKIDVPLTEKEMEQLSNSEVGAIENLLLRIMSKADKETIKEIHNLIPEENIDCEEEPEKEAVQDEAIGDCKPQSVPDDVTCINEEFKQRIGNQNKLIGDLKFKVAVANAIFDLKYRINQLSTIQRN